MQRHIVLCTFILLAVLWACTGWAGVSGPCYNCHTMHNSQDSQSMRLGLEPTPLPMLLRGTCIQCHTGSNNGNAGEAPYITNSVPPDYKWATSSLGVPNASLAGGSFYWAFIPEKGHNVEELFPGGDGPPPGGDQAAWGGRLLKCSGTDGCHGSQAISDPLLALQSAHHQDTGAPPDGTTVAASYRFLQGVLGYEDTSWEWSFTSNKHNRYVGEARLKEDQPPLTASISGLCARCHQTFHNYNPPAVAVNPGIVFDPALASLQTPWLRHPTDYDMTEASGAEYALYNSYMTQAPVARMSTLIDDGQNDSVGTGKAIIMCLTCHRAHGSPYTAMLRWNYKSWPGLDPFTGQLHDGCQICHSLKN